MRCHFDDFSIKNALFPLFFSAGDWHDSPITSVVDACCEAVAS
jgi:hypothetical protein